MPNTQVTNTATSLSSQFSWAFESDLGWIAIATDGIEVTSLKFGYSSAENAIAKLDYASDSVLQSATPELKRWQKALQAYAAGSPVEIGEIPVRVAPADTFTGVVNRMCREIPRGVVLTYGALAEQAGSPRAARAVGNVMRTNRIPLLIPCHRVVAATGLGGYSGSGGSELKQRLLAMENFPTVRPEQKKGVRLFN